MINPIPVVVNNLTPTFWSVCVLIVIVLASAMKQWPSLDRLKREGDASLRADLLKRIADLEAELSEERRRCDEKMAKLQGQFDGLQRMVIQWQVSSGRAMEFGGSTEAVKSIPRVEEHLARREGEEK
jgi:hypothetical protein